MSPEETSLARLLVALPGWRWVPGMASGTGRVYLGSGGVICWQGEGDRGGYIAAFDRCADLVGGLPDLHDPATAGILLGMLPRRHLSARDWDVYEVTVYDCPPLAGSVVHSGPHGTAKWWTVSGGSLGVAAARALVAIGRAS